MTINPIPIFPALATQFSCCVVARQCQGSRCMAWISIDSSSGLQTERIEGSKGYCGLVSK